MAYISIYKGIVFVEGDEPTAQRLGNVTYDKKYLYNSQLKSLDCVKEQLADKAIALGANAVLDFNYGQKSLGFFRSILLALDDNVNWYGSGVAAILSNERLSEIREKLQ